MSTSVVGSGFRSIGQLTYFHTNQTTLEGGFGPIPYLQLGEDVAYMVSHGLPTHEKPGRNLRVG
jgi:hypothetical protein